MTTKKIFVNIGTYGYMLYVMLISLIVDIIKKFNSVTQQDWSLLLWPMPKG